MKNPASVKEEEKGRYNLPGHGELSFYHYSLWLIIFIGLICLFNIAGPAVGGVPASPEAQGLSFYDQVKREVLDNGLTVLLMEDRQRPLVSIFLSVAAGSSQEGRFNGSGIAHFTEHMVFKGTSKRPAGAVFSEIESYGGTIDAFTSYDYVGYKITVPAEFALPSLELLADMVKNAAFEEGELAKEKQVVLKELRLNHDDPQRYGFYLLWQSAYNVHPYQYPILGQEVLFNRLSRKDLLEFYHARYQPRQMVLTVAGDIQNELCLSAIKENFKDFSPPPEFPIPEELEPPQNKLRRVEQEFTTGLTYLLMGFHSVAAQDADCPALDVLSVILGEGESSRLNKLICERKKLAYSVQAVNYTPRQPGLLIVSAALEKARQEAVVNLILKQVEAVKKKNVSDQELSAAKNKIASAILFSTQTVDAQGQDIGLNQTLTRDYRFSEKYLQNVKQVSALDLRRVAGQYLSQNSLNIVALTPRRGGAASSKEAAGRPFTVGVEKLTGWQVEPKEVTRYVLDNGLTLLVKEDHRLPLVSLKAVFSGGLRAENETNNGLANLTAEMLEKGTKTKNAAEIAAILESKGARISCYGGNNSSVVSLDMLSQDFDQMLALAADLINNPGFPQAEFRRQREEALARIRAEEDDIFATGMKLLKQTLLREHPYRFEPTGSERSLSKLKRGDLINFHRRFYGAKNMVLAVFGDVNEQDVLDRVKQLFSGLPTEEAPALKPKAEPVLQEIRTASKMVEKEQSLLLLGFSGATVFGPERYALEALCQILSQPSGRLFTQIREKGAMAYTLGAYSVAGVDPGYLVVYAATTAENVPAVKEEILRQLSLLQEQPLSAEELTQVKRTLIFAKELQQQTNSALALESALDELYGLGYQRYLEYAARINGLAPAEIQTCAKRYFNLNNYAAVVIGPH